MTAAVKASLAGVPAAAMLLPHLADRQPPAIVEGVELLRHAIAEVVSSIAAGQTDLVTLVVAGDTTMLSVADEVDLRPLGLAIRVPIARAPVPKADRDVDAVVIDQPALTGDAAVLALQVLHHGGEHLRLRTLTVPRDLDPDRIMRLASGMMRDGAVVVAGDLAATLTAGSPGYLVEGASDFDAQVVAAAVDSPDRLADVLARFGPRAAERVMAKGWMPLRLLAACAVQCSATLDVAAYEAPRGVGQIVIGASP